MPSSSDSVPSESEEEEYTTCFSRRRFGFAAERDVSCSVGEPILSALGAARAAVVVDRPRTDVFSS